MSSQSTQHSSLALRNDPERLYQETIGAITWVHWHGSEAQLIIPDLRYFTDHRLFEQLLRASVPREEIVEFGRVAFERGTKKPPSFHISQSRFPGLPLYRDFRPRQWKEVDGTIATSDEDATQFYHHGKGPIWDDNMCAYNCILVIARLLQAGSLYVDQIPWEGGLSELTLPAIMIIWAVRKPWGYLTLKELDQIQNEWQQSCFESDPSFTRGKFTSLAELLALSFGRLPQISSQTVKVGKCCLVSTKWYHFGGKSAPITDLPFFEIGSEHVKVALQTPLESLNFQSFLDARFGGIQTHKKPAALEQRCGKSGCTNGYIARTAFISRPPPRLAFSGSTWPALVSHIPQRYQADKGGIPGMFHDITLRYLSSSSTECSLPYVLIGWVAFKGSHYTLGWHMVHGLETQVISYDGMNTLNQGSFSKHPGKSLEDIFPRGANIGAMFYEIKDSS